MILTMLMMTTMMTMMNVMNVLMTMHRLTSCQLAFDGWIQKLS